jgi:hypothetical protein
LANDVCTRSQLEECTSRKSGRFWSWASMKWWAAHGRVAEPPSSAGAYGPYCRRRGHAEQTARVIAYARNPIEPVEPRLRPMAVTFAANDNIPKTARAYARPRPISRLALRLVLITLLVALFVVRLFSLLVLLSRTSRPSLIHPQKKRTSPLRG